ncbi:hypothetical protein [Gymnodinialimonas sp.]
MTQKHSPAYPNFPLEKAIQMASQVFEKDRKNEIDREVAAQHIGYSGLSGAAGKSLATLAHYGLVEKAGKGQLRVTQVLVDILHPDSEDDRREALRTAGLQPVVFQQIRDRFPDGTPSEAALKSWLMREEFLDRAINPVAKAYLETARYMEHSGAFESDGVHGPDGPESEVKIENMENNQVIASHSTTIQPAAAPVPDELNKINAQITGDTVQVSALLDLEGLTKLEKKIAALKDFLSS